MRRDVEGNDTAGPDDEGQFVIGSGDCEETQREHFKKNKRNLRYL